MMNKGNLGYGLNARGDSGSGKSKKKKKGLSGFGDDDSSDESTNSGGNNKKTTSKNNNARSTINKEIAAEQAALRKRAQTAMATSSTDVYDYDAEYDSFSSKKKQEDAKKSAAAAAKQTGNEPKQSRYIGNLLQTAQRRNQEQEVVHERQLAKEQATEDTSAEYEGKDKFVTSSYKRKLAEREQWAKEEAERSKREEDDDVTKKTGVGNFLFGGIGRSLLLGSGGDKGGASEGDTKKKTDDDDGDKRNVMDTKGVQDDREQTGQQQYRRESSRETEQWDNRSKRTRNDGAYEEDFANRKRPSSTSNLGTDIEQMKKASTSKVTTIVKTRQQILEERAIKIREARERYFERRGISPQ